MRLNITELDHIAINVTDIDESLRFYSETLGLRVERLSEFRDNNVTFPSIRITAGTIIDLFPPAVHRSTGGQNVNHIALHVDEQAESIKRFLHERHIAVVQHATNNFGARGQAESFYVHDPDGNIVELRTYKDDAAA